MNNYNNNYNRNKKPYNNNNQSKNNNNYSGKRNKGNNRVNFETPIPYNTQLDATKLEITKVYDSTNTYSIKLPIFDGKGGLETFLHVLNKYLKATRYELDFFTADDYHYDLLIPGFAKVLENEAYSFFQNEAAELPDNDKATWDKCIQQMKISFGGGTLARDHILDYLKTPECIKKRSSTVEDHTRRIMRIINIANEVQGTIPKIDNRQALTIIKNTMPRLWQANFSVSGLTIESCSLQELINYFAQQKRTTDFTDFYSNNRFRSSSNSSFRKRHFNSSSSNQNNSNNNNNNNDKRFKSNNNDDPNASCPIHPNGNHKWGQCFHNARRNANNTTNPRNTRFTQHNNSAWRAPNNSTNSSNRDQHFIQQQQSPPFHSQNSQSSTIPSQVPYPQEHHAYESIGPVGPPPNTNRNNHANNNHCGWSNYDANGTWLG